MSGPSKAHSNEERPLGLDEQLPMVGTLISVNFSYFLMSMFSFCLGMLKPRKYNLQCSL